MSILQERKDRELARKRHQLDVGKTVRQMFAEGKSNKEIADVIGVAEGTVRMITKNLKKEDCYGYKGQAQGAF